MHAGMHHLANSYMQKCILPIDACGLTYCHQMHTGMHPTNRYVANRCMWECTSPTDANSDAYLHRQAGGGMTIIRSTLYSSKRQRTGRVRGVLLFPIIRSR